ncbi:MAG: ABC-type transport system involved in resistance to organic solvent, periplasmic component [Cyanobacteria bacterium RYN_339]|nr:ABC-type transport system involved in resistance to organic solvent, periplasmic component [Cyanobacteria bacterium RYN_339]
MSKKINNEVLLGGFIVVAGGLLAYMSVAVGGLNMNAGIHVTARFTNASGLVKDAVVSVAGVQVGKIEKLEVDHDQAIVHIFINRDANIRKDVEATIRAKSLLGEKYMELRPQSRDAATMKEGDQIAVTRPSVEVDEVLAAMGPLIKKVNPDDIATVIHVAARALEGQEVNIQKTVQNANAITEQINGFLKNNRGNLDKAAVSVASLASNGDAMLKANRGRVDSTMARVDHLSGVLDRETPSLVAKGQRIATNVDGIAKHLNKEAPGLTKGVKDTMANANAALVKVPKTLDNMNTLTTGATATMGKVDPLLDKVNSVTSKDVENFAHDTLNHGMKIYVAPFGPSAPEYQKLPTPTPTPSAK